MDHPLHTQKKKGSAFHLYTKGHIIHFIHCGPHNRKGNGKKADISIVEDCHCLNCDQLLHLLMFGIEMVPAQFISRIDIETTYNVNVLWKCQVLNFQYFKRKWNRKGEVELIWTNSLSDPVVFTVLAHGCWKRIDSHCLELQIPHMNWCFVNWWDIIPGMEFECRIEGMYGWIGWAQVVWSVINLIIFNCFKFSVLSQHSTFTKLYWMVL